MSTPTQDTRPIAITTPLGKDVLLLKDFDLHDTLGHPFRLEASLQSTSDTIDFNGIMGKNVTISIDLPNYQKRYLNGYVAQFVQTGYTEELANYRALIVPWIWFLSRGSNCRIFHNKTVPEIVKEVCGDYGFSSIETESLTGKKYYSKPHCVQYDETDLNFVSRLLEEAGIYYFFKHTQTEASLVLADSNTAHAAFPGFSSLTYNPERNMVRGPDRIYEWLIQQEVQPSTFSLNDYDYTAPKKSLLESGLITQTYDHHDSKQYSYPGNYDFSDEKHTEHDGDQLATARIQEVQTRQAVQRGEGSTAGLATGYTFQLKSYPRQDQNQEYLLTTTELTIRTADFTIGADQSAYSRVSRFSAMSTTGRTFRPPRVTPKSRIPGPQTATVVGPPPIAHEGTMGTGKGAYATQGVIKLDSEDETPPPPVDTDKYGSVHVQFHWDREGKTSKEPSIHLVRVSQNWAGEDWGGMFIPHIGTEVVVSFENGDPDRPLITGRVYNEQKKPPKDPSANPDLSYIRDSSKLNWIEMDATKNSEKVTLTNNKNHLTMDATSGAETILLAQGPKEDGVNYVFMDKKKGTVKTNNADKSVHWTWGKWEEWTFGVKNSVVVGPYIKLYQGTEFGITTGNKTAVVLGPELKYNTAMLGSLVGPGLFSTAKLEVYSGNCYKIIYGAEYKVETSSRKKLNATDDEHLNTRWKALFATRDVVTAVKNAEKNAGTKDMKQLIFTRTTATNESSTVGGTSTETVTGMKSITALGGIQLTSGPSFIDVKPTGITGISSGPVTMRGGIIAMG